MYSEDLREIAYQAKEMDKKLWEIYANTDWACGMLDAQGHIKYERLETTQFNGNDICENILKNMKVVVEAIRCQGEKKEAEVVVEL
jgi:hypothetical protein